jgi:DNA-binding transcriptional regulator LsrR (DeoR family)
MNTTRSDVRRGAVVPPGVSEADYRLGVRAAMLYYQGGLTQSEIGEQLGYSRIKINRVLAMARERGILEIRVKIPAGWHLDLETDLVRLYGLRDAVVVTTDQIGRSLESVLAAGAADWLAERLQPGMRIGLGLGRTIAHLPETFRPARTVDCTFIEAVGAAYTHDWARFDVTFKMAELAGGTRESLFAPGVVTDPDLGVKLAMEPLVADALEKARRSDIILQSVGPVDASAILFEYGILAADDLDDLRRRGAVGDAMGYYFDINGDHVEFPTDLNLIGIKLADLRDIPWSVLVAGGEPKVRAIAGGMNGGYFNVLVTDDVTARALVELKGKAASE